MAHHTNATTPTLFPESDLCALAEIIERDVGELRDELARRPWHLHDLLSEPETAEAVLGSDDGPVVFVSPLLYFAVVVHHSAAELSSATWVAEWTGPSLRLPVFDVGPLLEFTRRPTRLLHIARVLTSFANPAMSEVPVPVGVLDLDGLVDWLGSVEPNDQALVLQRMGDIALFLAGVCADQTGQCRPPGADAVRRRTARHLDRHVGRRRVGADRPRVHESRTRHTRGAGLPVVFGCGGATDLYPSVTDLRPLASHQAGEAIPQPHRRHLPPSHGMEHRRGRPDLM